MILHSELEVMEIPELEHGQVIILQALQRSTARLLLWMSLQVLIRVGMILT